MSNSSSRYPDYYAVLGVHHSASREEIKRAYYALSRRIHPDKQQHSGASDIASEANDNPSVKFHELSRAWEVLSDLGQRRDYDRQLNAQQNKFRGVIQDEVDLDDMDFDEEIRVFSFPCRCSSQYEISEDDLDEGREIAPCSGCSLKIKVLYDVAED
ncbi:hypothetical protein GGI25_000986 [Coemansia spiralis]|uniref:Diphthamide biosynthesis protein 4 n=2 Tax=Coemansia TaxID=4863 RepID=A0A9W8GBS0_9FUNG|nr:DnaJ domain-containing protein [Coemansia spiralis]KAJ1993843.1 hypothetical protein EDC05_002004 [Coemansia umbellata]KAJ2623219.1 hypothetical protein GGI26_002634 [Coemansia sp. RSA 1358]KAJ2680097.1 hypothetical protein GGI25_000986 [Coemansia spiralis]